MSDRTIALYGVFAGQIDDGGFIESGYRGALAARDRFGIRFDYVQGVGIETAPLSAAVEAAARTGPDLLVVHGGRSDEAVEATASRHSAVAFLSTHGDRAGANFSCYGIRQFQSAFLAGALAGWMTRSGTVGHLSGIRIAPGLRSRAAYAHGVSVANPQARVVTCFCGTQDDNAAAKRAALAEFDQGVDIIYTMLNSGRTGAIDACRERGIPQIGNVRDWTAVHPDVFIASAIADTGRLVERWVEAVLGEGPARGAVAELGIEDPAAVRLEMSARVPESVRVRVASLADAVRSGRIEIAARYDGPEFLPDAQLAVGR